MELSPQKSGITIQHCMHKDPPPGLLERPVQAIVLYGLLTGFVAGVVFFGAWSLFSGAYSGKPTPPAPLADRVR